MKYPFPESISSTLLAFFKCPLKSSKIPTSTEGAVTVYIYPIGAGQSAYGSILIKSPRSTSYIAFIIDFDLRIFFFLRVLINFKLLFLFNIL